MQEHGQCPPPSRGRCALSQIKMHSFGHDILWQRIPLLYWRRDKAMSFTHFVPINWTHGRRITVVLATVSLLYLALVGAFFFYRGEGIKAQLSTRKKLARAWAQAVMEARERLLSVRPPERWHQPQFMRPSLSGTVLSDTLRRSIFWQSLRLSPRTPPSSRLPPACPLRRGPHPLASGERGTFCRRLLISVNSQIEKIVTVDKLSELISSRGR